MLSLEVVLERSAPLPAVALVLGAGTYEDGTPTASLYDRVKTGVDLYLQGRVQRLLLSSDNRAVYRYETDVMHHLARKLGVPAAAIQVDPLGRRTYDSCYRARHVFGLNELVVVTQNFHLPRSLQLCSHFGLKVFGVSANRRSYRLGSRWYWQTRELFATVKAWLDLYVLHPHPSLEAAAT